MRTFTQWILEGRSFEYGGSKYSSGFGKYTKDGTSISKEEYQRASDAYKGDTKPKSPTKSKKPIKPTLPQKPKKTISDSKSKTAGLLAATPFRECKTIKELEKHVTEFSGLNCKLNGITNKKVANELASNLHKVLSKYPGVADSHFLNNFVTQAGIKKQAEEGMKDYFESEDYKKFVDSEYKNAVEKYGYGKEGTWLSKSLQMLGWRIDKIQLFCLEHNIYDSVWNAKIDERLSKALKEEFYTTKKKYDEKHLPQTPKFSDTSHAYAFYSTCEKSNRRFAGVYLNPKTLKTVETEHVKSVERGFFPKGTSVGSLVVHEVGHALAELLDLSKDEEIKSLYDPKTAGAELSIYAAIGGIDEFISEAVAEYVTSENPRPLCKKVGEIIDKKYQDYMRLL